jgi:hypothetical protein
VSELFDPENEVSWLGIARGYGSIPATDGGVTQYHNFRFGFMSEIESLSAWP